MEDLEIQEKTIICPGHIKRLIHKQFTNARSNNKTKKKADDPIDLNNHVDLDLHAES